MKSLQLVSIVATVILCVTFCASSIANARNSTKPSRDYPVKPVPFTAVHLNDIFWAPRIEINRTVTIPFAFQKCEETGRMANLERAAAVIKGNTDDRKLPGYPFDDTDI